MSTKNAADDFDAVAPPLSMQELARVLVRHYGLSTGKYDLGIEFQIGTGPVGPDKASLVPGVILGVKSVGLARSTTDGPMTVDAEGVDQVPEPQAAVSSEPPAKKARRKTSIRP